MAPSGLEAEDGAELVFPDVRADTNLRTTLEKIIARAGVKQWPKLWQKLAQKVAHGVGSKGLGMSLDGLGTVQPIKRKAQEIPGFDAVCRLLARDGFSPPMGDEGLEPPTFSV